MGVEFEGEDLWQHIADGLRGRNVRGEQILVGVAATVPFDRPTSSRLNAQRALDPQRPSSRSRPYRAATSRRRDCRPESCATVVLPEPPEPRIQDQALPHVFIV